MHTTFIRGLAMAVAVAASNGMIQQVAARGVQTNSADVTACATQTAAFTTPVIQGISVFSPKRLFVVGTCFAQGASLAIYDYTAGALLTNGWIYISSDTQERFSYPVAGAQCRHLLEVVVKDVANNMQAYGNGKIYGPCQVRPVLELAR